MLHLIGMHVVITPIPEQTLNYHYTNYFIVIISLAVLFVKKIITWYYKVDFIIKLFVDFIIILCIVL